MTIETRIHEAGANQTIRLTVNGDSHELLVFSNDTLLNVLRNDLQLTGTKYGCGTGDCCACTVQVDNQSVLSCLSLASDLDGSTVITVEGLIDGRNLHPIQESFVEHGAVQCGFCTPGMIMSSSHCLTRIPTPQKPRSGITCGATSADARVTARLLMPLSAQQKNCLRCIANEQRSRKKS